MMLMTMFFFLTSARLCEYSSHPSASHIQQGTNCQGIAQQPPSVLILSARYKTSGIHLVELLRNRGLISRLGGGIYDLSRLFEILKIVGYEGLAKDLLVEMSGGYKGMPEWLTERMNN